MTVPAGPFLLTFFLRLVPSANSLSRYCESLKKNRRIPGISEDASSLEKRNRNGVTKSIHSLPASAWESLSPCLRQWTRPRWTGPQRPRRDGTSAGQPSEGPAGIPNRRPVACLNHQTTTKHRLFGIMSQLLQFQNQPVHCFGSFLTAHALHVDVVINATSLPKKRRGSVFGAVSSPAAPSAINSIHQLQTSFDRKILGFVTRSLLFGCIRCEAT